ncbi:MAG: acylphosphatase [Synergistaceae bacterium]|nr:acylphosphatase [Synergistaceae bacterium]
MIRRRQFLNEGRVQGVGFRHWAARSAQKLNLTGLVRNLPEGSVEVQAQGSEQSVNVLDNLLRKGPSSARVVRVTAIDCPLKESEDSFLVRHF